jgi:DMSO/TMAO reductase YedYZ molybdopterin-dependent catalytic subunit
MAMDLELLHSLPAYGLATRLRSPRGVRDYAFRGVLLYDYATAAGLLGESPSANQYFRATAADGFVVAVAMAEVAPGFSEKQVLLAYEQDGEQIRAGVRLVVPGDDLGGRSVFGLDNLDVCSVESPPLSSAPASSSLRVSGQVERTAEHDIQGLGQQAQTEVAPVRSKGHGEGMRPERRFTGVLAWSLLEKAGLVLDAAINEHVLRKLVVARDAEGYAVVIAAGELEPRFQAAPFIVALRADGGDLTANDGGLRLVAPFDLAGARHVKGLASLEVREA